MSILVLKKSKQPIMDGEYLNITPSYSNIYSVGDRRQIMSCSGNCFSQGSGENLINGNYEGNSSNSVELSGSDGVIEFAFNTPVRITGLRWKQSNSNSHGTWKVEVFANNAWKDIQGATFTLGGSTASEYSFNANTEFANRYRLTQIAGSSSTSPWCYEIEFECSMKTKHALPLVRDYRNNFGLPIKRRSLSEHNISLGDLKGKLITCPSNCTSATSNPDFEIISGGDHSDAAGHAAYRAFDNNRDTNWSASSSANGWIGWMHKNGKVIVRAYELMGRPSYSQYPTSWNLEGSNDGINWNILDARPNMGSYIANNPRLFLVPGNNRAYAYHRINVLTANNHCSLNIVQAWRNSQCQIELPLETDAKDIANGLTYSASNITYGSLDNQKCAIFNGSNSYVNLGRNAPFNQREMTVELLFFPCSNSGAQTIISKTESSGFGFSIDSGMAYSDMHVGGSYRSIKDSTGAVQLNKWNQAILTFTGTEVCLYINGICVGIISCTGEISNSSAYLLLGAEPTSSGIDGYYFNGGIKKVKILTYGYTEADVKKSFAKVSEICK